VEEFLLHGDIDMLAVVIIKALKISSRPTKGKLIITLVDRVEQLGG